MFCSVCFSNTGILCGFYLLFTYVIKLKSTLIPLKCLRHINFQSSFTSSILLFIHIGMCAVWTYLCLHTHTTRYFYVWWWKSKYFAYMLLNPTHLIRITLKRRIHLMKHSNGAQNVCKYIFHGKYKICWACEWLSVVTVFCHLYEHKMSIKWMAKVDVIRWKSLYYVQKTF